MATGADVRTHAMSNGAFAGIVHLLGHLTEARSCAYGGLPGGVVHAKVLKVDHVDGDSAIIAAEACLMVSPGTRKEEKDKENMGSP
jgi:hypothetical protein